MLLLLLETRNTEILLVLPQLQERSSHAAFCPVSILVYCSRFSRLWPLCTNSNKPFVQLRHKLHTVFNQMQFLQFIPLPDSLSPLDLHLGNHCWCHTTLTSVGKKHNGSGWRTIASAKTLSGEPLIRHWFCCRNRCAYSSSVREISPHFTNLFWFTLCWNDTRKDKGELIYCYNNKYKTNNSHPSLSSSKLFMEHSSVFQWNCQWHSQALNIFHRNKAWVLPIY